MNIQDKNEVRELTKSALAELNYDRHVLDAPEAIELMMGTWAAESIGGKYLRQLNNGPARGAWQCEKATFLDIIKRASLFHQRVLGQSANFSDAIYPEDFTRLELNHKLAVQVARLKYYLCPGQIPKDLFGWSLYWKQWYNTEKGAGTPEGFQAKYKRYCL